jgi:hypothetical protein
MILESFFFQDKFLNVFGYLEKFEDPHPPPISGVAALGASPHLEARISSGFMPSIFMNTNNKIIGFRIET